jgi:hypothetical protein
MSEVAQLGQEFPARELRKTIMAELLLRGNLHCGRFVQSEGDTSGYGTILNQVEWVVALSGFQAIEECNANLEEPP